VHAAYVEAGCDASRVADALASELRAMARWLALDSIALGSKGGLARRLKHALA
jgi:hypothetical protein